MFIIIKIIKLEKSDAKLHFLFFFFAIQSISYNIFSTIRCQSFSFFFFVFYLYILKYAKKNNNYKILWTLPVLNIIWANLHGGFAIGLIMTVYQFGFNIPHLIATSFIFMFGQFIEGNFVTPKLVGDKIKLHPLWIIFALFSGGSLFGFYGLLLALPIAGVLGVLVRFYIKDLRNG